jgi:acetyltransferase-like isoleucine patch superfamily enzyme
MFRILLEQIIRLKNPAFRFDNNISTAVIVLLFWQKASMKLRAQRLFLFGRKPAGLFLGRGVRFFNLKNIRWGRFVQLEDGVLLHALGSKPLEIGDNVRIGAHSRIVISTTFQRPGLGIRIGKNVGIGEFSYLGGAGGLVIGDDCIIGQYFSTHPENHVFSNKKQLIRLQNTQREGIEIGANCWIGSKVTLLDGISLGEGCVVAAGAVVTRSFDAGSVIGGVPARVLKMRYLPTQTPVRVPQNVFFQPEMVCFS